MQVQELISAAAFTIIINATDRGSRLANSISQQSTSWRTNTITRTRFSTCYFYLRHGASVAIACTPASESDAVPVAAVVVLDSLFVVAAVVPDGLFVVQALLVVALLVVGLVREHVHVLGERVLVLVIIVKLVVFTFAFGEVMVGGVGGVSSDGDTPEGLRCCVCKGRDMWMRREV